MRSVSFRLPFIWRVSGLRLGIISETDFLEGRGFCMVRDVRRADVMFGEGTAIRVAVFMGPTMLNGAELVRMESGNIYCEDELVRPGIGRRVLGDGLCTIVPSVFFKKEKFG